MKAHVHRSAARIARLAVTMAAFALGACVQAPLRETPAPAPFVPPIAAPDDDGPLLARDGEFAVVVVQPGEDLARLAERWLGDRSRRNVIAEFNHVDEVRAGHTVAIPLKNRNPFGVQPTGM